MKTTEQWFSEPKLHVLVNDPKCYIPVKTARLRNLERELVINERGRGVSGTHQVMAVHRANSVAGSSNICSVTEQQSKASCLGRGSEWSAGTPGSAGYLSALSYGWPSKGWEIAEPAYLCFLSCYSGECNACSTCQTLGPLRKLITDLAPSLKSKLLFLLACVNME